ncbi:hypothetical protein AAHA92_27039 [Salvia divinorum]|uniref:DUF868 family protein n=1 Tax=Salvia divinorum TaxID=28513 RepID=A0ABD1G5M0_SALDI
MSSIYSISSAHQSPARSSDQKIAQCTVSCVYQTHIAGHCDCGVEQEHHVELVVDLCGKRGATFMVDGNQLELYWDLRSAKLSGPELSNDFYVALVSDEEVVLLLGDMEKKAYKTTKARAAMVKALMFYKEEHVFGKKSFSTRMRFDQGKEHEVVVESSTAGDKDPEMWISIDGIVLIHIRNLQWKFRGNQTVVVNKQPVQVFWDVHAWLFSSPGAGHGLFIFKAVGEGDSEGDDDTQCDGSDCSGPSKYCSTDSYSKTVETCFFLYAWKIE